MILVALLYTLTFTGTFPLQDNFGTCEDPVFGYGAGDSIRVDASAQLIGDSRMAPVRASVRGRRGERFTLTMTVPYRYAYRCTLTTVKLNNNVAGCPRVMPAMSR